MRLRAGFIPLVDAAVLLVAARRGFAAREGVALELTREQSWATLRDKLSAGVIDAAHMLAPIPVASQLAIGVPKAPMVAPVVLSANGNAISVSLPFLREMEASGLLGAPRDPAATARALAAAVRARQARGDPATFAIVHPLSCHNFALRHLLAHAGVHPDRDVVLTVVPPPFVVRAVADGDVDGFCVGAPWSEVGAAAGVSRTIIAARDLSPMAPEKVLALAEAQAAREPDLVDALVRALTAAAGWAADPANRGELAELLAARDALDIEAGPVAASLAGAVALREGVVAVDDYIVFDRAGGMVPRRADALFLYAEMVRWRMARLGAAEAAAAARAFRPDIFARAVGAAAAEGGEGPRWFDGAPFDPADIEGYLARAPFAEAGAA